MKLVETLELEVNRGEFRVCLFTDGERVAAVSVDLDANSAVNVFERLAKAVHDEAIKPRGLPPEGFRLFAYHAGAPVEWATMPLQYHPGDERYSLDGTIWQHPSRSDVEAVVGDLSGCEGVEPGPA